ncbi:MAG TPA: hypothetical protein VH639_11695 [Bryobacteraceae bacterium]|jgi:hypothetical protein
MKTKILAVLLLAGGSLFARPHFSIGIGVGVPVAAPPPPPPVYYAAPPVPGPGYTWINGYYYPSGSRWAWRSGYWARRPVAGAVWVRPHYRHGRYYAGYWRR